MTENELRNLPVAWLEKFNGCKQGSSGHKTIIKVFNDSGLCKRYKMTLNDYWCAATASACMIAVGLADIFPCVECSCNAMIRMAKAAGIWVENDAYVPKTGDKVLYDWDDNGKGDCVGEAEHIGTVVSVSGGYIDVIEGNMGSGYVGHRKLAVNGRYIRGFITPKFASKATKPSTTPSTPSSTSSSFKVGDKVKVINAVTYNGTKFKTYTDKYDVLEVKGDRVVIGVGKVVTAAVNAKNLAKVSAAPSISIGDKVTVIKAVTYDGKPFKAYYKKYDVLSVKGDRVVIGIGKTVTADIKISNIKKA